MFKILQKYIFTQKKKKTFPLQRHKNTLLIENIEKRQIFQKRKIGIFNLKKQIFNFQILFQNKLIILSIFIGFIGFLLIGILFGPYFRIKNILISKGDILTNIEQAYESVEYARGENIFLLDRKNLIERLKNAQGSLESIIIRINIPSSLYIELKSYIPIFQTKDFFILSNGSFQEKAEKEIGDIPFITIISDNPDLFLFGNTLNISDLKNIVSLSQSLIKNIPSFENAALIYYVQEKELLIKEDLSTLYIFDLENNIQDQIQQLAILRKEKPEIYEKKYIYVDVRIPGKIFLCSVENEYLCKKNIRTFYGEAPLTLGEQ